MHHYAAQLMLLRYAEAVGILAYPIDAQEQLSVHAGSSSQIEGYDVRVFVVLQVATVVIEQRLVGEEHVGEVLDALAMISSNELEPPAEPFSFLVNTRHYTGREKNVTHAGVNPVQE